MARMLYCTICEALAAVTVDKPKHCAACGNPVEWRDLQSQPFTLTQMDRLFLKGLRISSS